MIVLHRENLSRCNQAIYICNHQNGYDFPTLGEVIKNHFYILADFSMKKDFFVNLINCLNGCIYVNRLDKDSKRHSKDEMLRILQRGNNILLFPEATWNLNPCKLLLPLYWGVIDLAVCSSVPIIPIGIAYGINKRVCSIVEPISFSTTVDKGKAIEDIKEILSTLIWEGYEKIGKYKRDELPESVHAWKREILSTYKNIDEEYEHQAIRNEHNYDIITIDMDHLIPCRENAFLFRK